MDDVFDNIAWEHNARIRAANARRILNVVPDEGSAVGDDVDVQKEQRGRRFDREAFKIVVGPIFQDVIDADEPCVLCIHQPELSVGFLEVGVAQAHVVADRMEIACTGDFHESRFARDYVRAETKSAIGETMGLLKHFALAAAAGSLVHEGDDVVVGRHNLDRGAVGGDPAFVNATVDQGTVYALLGARARVEVV